MGKQNSKLKPEIVNDLIEQTEFSENELKDWYRGRFLKTISLNHMIMSKKLKENKLNNSCLLYTSPSPRDGLLSRMPSSA